MTRGLRREELASLAGVSLTWYTWLEQGREINVSAETLHRIARVLRLTASDEAYLLKLAGLPLRSSIGLMSKLERSGVRPVSGPVTVKKNWRLTSAALAQNSRSSSGPQRAQSS